MNLEIQRADREEWESYRERCEQATPFHRADCLSVLADHAGADLFRLVGLNGQQPVGLFPVFDVRRGGVSAVFSPPPNQLIPYLGPAMHPPQSPKQRRIERRRRTFVEDALEWIESNCDPSYYHFRTGYRYDDPRPFAWGSFDVTPKHTYLVDLTVDRDDQLASFSRDARSNVQSPPEEVTFELGDAADVRRIVRLAERRHDEQGVRYPLDPELAVDLYRELPEDRCRAYVARDRQGFAGGLLVLDDGTTAYRWQGATRFERDWPVNDLLDWEVMEDSRERGLETYDLVGADTPKLNEYKAKFNPSLARYHTFERGSAPFRLAASVYQRIK